MSRLAFGLLSAISLVSSGCFLGHGEGSDAGSPWGAPPALADGALPPTIDAALPPIDEPDLDPDARPSDDPGASDWTDPPPASGDPCCDVGEVVGIDDATRLGGFPVVAWDSSAWGVVWADHPPPDGRSPFVDGNDVFLRLDADARPLSPRRPLWGFGQPTVLTYASERYALAAELPLVASTHLGLLDRSGALVDVTRLEGFTISGLARFPLAHVWVAAGTLDSSPEAQLRAFDDSLSPVGEPLELGVSFPWRAPALVALKSRLVVFGNNMGGIEQTTVAGSALTQVSEGMVLPTSGDPFTAVAATAMRDTAVAVGLDGTHVWSVVYDPFSGEVHAPTQVAPSATQGGLGVAADPVGGTVGVCHPQSLPTGGPPPYGALQFALLDPEGAPIGAPVSIGAGVHPTRCAVASAGPDQYVVVFWDPFSLPDGIAQHSIWAARVTVRR